MEPPWSGLELGAGPTIGDPFDVDSSDTSALELDSTDSMPQTGPAAGFDAVGGGGRILGSGLDDLGDPGPMPDLELEEIAAPPSAAPPSAAPAARSFARPSAASAPVARASPSAPVAGASMAPPTPQEPEAGPLGPPISPAAVAVVAEYGEPPSGWLGAVPYALLVLTRQRALRASLADLTRLLTRAELDHREALVALGRAVHGAPESAGEPSLAAALTAAQEAGQRAGQRTTEWEKSREVAETQRGSLEAKLGEVEEAAKPYRDRETKLATQMDVRQANLRRAKAKLARAEIEIRNLDAPEADTSRRGPLEAEREARRAEVQSTQGHVDDLTPQLESARRELAVMLEARNDLEGQLRALGKARERTERIHLTTAGEAEAVYHEAVARLAGAALDSGFAETLAPGPARAARLMASTEETRSREVALHRAALTAYDRRWLARGLVIVGVAGLIIVTMLVFVLVR